MAHHTPETTVQTRYHLMNSTITLLTQWAGMDSGSLVRVIMQHMIPTMVTSAQDIAVVIEFRQELGHLQHGIIREDLKLCLEPISDLKIRPTWTMTLQDLKSLLLEDHMERMALEFSIQSLLGTQRYQI